MEEQQKYDTYTEIKVDSNGPFASSIADLAERNKSANISVACQICETGSIPITSPTLPFPICDQCKSDLKCIVLKLRKQISKKKT